MAFSDRFTSILGKQKDPRSQPPQPLTRAEMDSMENELNDITGRLEAERKNREGIARFFKHPLRVLTEQPVNILIVCLPLSLIVFIGGFISMVKTYGIAVLFNSTVIDDFAILAILISIIPVAILDFREQRRMSNLEDALPNFFRDLAGMNDSGMTLPSAVHLVAGAEYGALTPHIRKLDNEMSWGVGFVEGMYRFGKNLGTPLADRSVDLIAKASKAGGDISEVLRAAANDTFEVVNLAQERRNNMFIYVIIVIVSWAVFLFVIAILVSSFLSTMATAGAAAQMSAASSKFMGRVDLPAYKRLFSHAAMIQGFFSGLCAGQMGEGRVVAGLKYSAIMLIISWVVFRFFI
ncbi:type II secretion system F family protein [Methanoregula sp.]|uniref:type II secretion system F family protein n=1 Tax=Methanoregula sp. TaxID=2052170 RepID=UPI003BAF4B22